MATILVDIKESDLVNFIVVERMNLHSFNNEGVKQLFTEYPFLLYKKRMMGDYMVTIQISLDDFILFKIHQLVK